MRKLIVLSFLTLDGIIQGPGEPEEDPSGGFTYGGWIAPLWDDVLEQTLLEQMGHPFDLVFGRKTYEIFAAYWPYQNSDENPNAARLNAAKKYVASHPAEPRLEQLDTAARRCRPAHELRNEMRPVVNRRKNIPS